MDLALTLLALVFGTLGYLGAMLLIRMFGESIIQAHRDRRGRDRRGSDRSFAGEKAPNLGAR